MNQSEWEQWVNEFLFWIGAPNTPQNQSFLAAWFGREGADQGFNNPFNITWAPLGNGVVGQGGSQGNILKFGDIISSAENTAAFIEHGYNNILAAIKSGNPWTANDNGTLSSELSTWSNGGYTSLTQGTSAPTV